MQRLDDKLGFNHIAAVVESPSSWSNSYLIDELKRNLATVELSKSNVTTDLLDRPNHEFKSYFSLISKRHYVNQAFHYLKIGVFKPRDVPKFRISLLDLSAELTKQIATLDKTTRDFVLKEAVGRIFEDINPKLYHNSISSVLKVELIDQ